MNPKVSVVIPTYNRADFIGLTLESVLRQTYTDYEIVVVDDGSTDDTQAVVRRITPGARYIYQDNQGIPEVLNRCLREAHGQYVQLVGSDDLLLSETLERSVAVLDANRRVGVVHGSAWLIDESGNKISLSRPEFATGDYVRAGREEIRDLLFSNHVVATTVMARLTCLRDAGMFDTRFGLYEDWNLWTRVARRCDIAYLHQPLACYRVHFGASGSVFAKASASEIARYRRMHLDEVMNDETLCDEYRGIKGRVMARHHMVIARRAYETNEMGYARKEALRAAASHPGIVPSAASLLARTLPPARVIRWIRARGKNRSLKGATTGVTAQRASE